MCMYAVVTVIQAARPRPSTATEQYRRYEGGVEYGINTAEGCGCTQRSNDGARVNQFWYTVIQQKDQICLLRVTYIKVGRPLGVGWLLRCEGRRQS